MLVTVSDFVMTDGKSLEHNPVIPDEIVLPTPEDLATDRDPVLSRAAQLAGVDLSPEKAAELFPITWRRL
jgi:C-terminal processing protease CtpA/Prc